MYHADTLREKIRLFLTILWPILITQISLSAMNLVDTMMSGRVGTDDLAGVAIGSSLWVPIFTGMNGVMLAITPIIAHFMGANERHKIHNTVTQALYLAIIIGIGIIGIGGLALNPILNLMELDPSVRHIAFHYLVGLSIGIIPLFLSNVIRNFFDGQGYTRITMWITVLALPFNVLLNYCLIFGHFGLPKLGGIGAGYATGITFWIILIVSMVMTFKVESVKAYRLFVQWVKPSVQAWKEQLSIGIPIGMSIFFEASIFSVVTLLIGSMFATTIIAANQVVMNFSAMLFMVPLSISMAITIVVGYSIGGERFKSAKQYSLIGVLGAVGFVAVGAVGMYIFKEDIASLYSSDPDVIHVAAQLFIFAIIFQLSDALQASLQGVLRGYKDVTVAFYIALVAYWLVGIPSGYLLAAFTELGPAGFWVGITIGLTGAAVGFFVRLQIIYRNRKAKAHLSADGH
ncbi:MATE family efflux transporter [Xylanibacillus composti]|uniref:Probable multidrug resistance protein NorM n=1 Tax=Xylanibacillus composti TaxID=1572762 RepID=A0A8J4H940_9BACL|nr:MATE family efflux transporter [Xylanibacillus composti]MDT9727205.1 MATE family efflux transporter [Xylanibacillus composti]GIQ71514.1 putative multidrug resistance protein NorM [Xylanibacillus composti]